MKVGDLVYVCNYGIGDKISIGVVIIIEEKHLPTVSNKEHKTRDIYDVLYNGSVQYVHRARLHETMEAAEEYMGKINERRT